MAYKYKPWENIGDKERVSIMLDVSQVERQLYILALLSESKKGYTLDEIAKSLYLAGIDISKKTIARDIDYISMGSFFITEEKRNNQTYYIANKFGIKNISFTISELISMHFIREVIKPYSSLDIGSIANNLVEKIIGNLPTMDKAYLESLNEFIKVNQPDINLEKSLNKDVINIIRKGIEFKRKLLISYYSFNSDESTQRQFDPYLIEIYEGCYHLVGYCHLRNSIRDLRISRIIDIKLLDDTYERPENFYETYKKGRFGKLSGDENIKLVLKFKGDAARYITEYESNKADLLYYDENGLLIFEKDTTMTPEIVKWILSFGAKVEVIEPKALRQEIIGHAQDIINSYNQG